MISQNNFKPLSNTPWFLTIFQTVGDHPCDGGSPFLGWRMTMLGMVDYHPGTSILPSWGQWVTILVKKVTILRMVGTFLPSTWST